ncbi:MAG: CBS domain-containing protein [Gemmataceae bacterium]
MSQTMPTELEFLILPAADLMNRNVVSVSETESLNDAISTLTKRGIGGVPVINAAGRPVGVLTQSDVLVHDRTTAGGQQSVPEFYQRADLHAASQDALSGLSVESIAGVCVRDVMTPVVFSVAPTATAKTVVEELLRLRVHRMFVVDDAGVLVGVIGTTDLLRRLLD